MMLVAGSWCEETRVLEIGVCVCVYVYVCMLLECCLHP